MSNVTPFQMPVDENESLGPVAADPKPFVKAITTPAGLPWDQRRAAQLEARAGAPLPLAQLVYQLKRLEPWSSGKSGRFAAAYIRAAEVKDILRATAEIDGRAAAFAFYSPSEQQRRVRSLLLVGTAAALTTALLLVGVGSALRAKSQAESSLASLERAVILRDREVKAQETRRQEARALNGEGLSGRALTDFLNDLAWASDAKASDARIRAMHWDHGYLAVEARGDAPPFNQTSRRVERSSKPVKRGVWLWGVAPEGAQ